MYEISPAENLWEAVSRKLTLVMTVCPSWSVTKSLTDPGGAAPRWLPPMKWGGTLNLAA